MLFEGPARQSLAKRFVPAIAAVAVLLSAVAIPAFAGVLDPLNPFASGTIGPITPEEKARRDQARTELYDRLSPEYSMTLPFVSDAAAEALQRGIEQYRQIVAMAVGLRFTETPRFGPATLAARSLSSGGSSPSPATFPQAAEQARYSTASFRTRLPASRSATACASADFSTPAPMPRSTSRRESDCSSYRRTSPA